MAGNVKRLSQPARSDQGCAAVTDGVTQAERDAAGCKRAVNAWFRHRAQSYSGTASLLTSLDADAPPSDHGPAIQDLLGQMLGELAAIRDRWLAMCDRGEKPPVPNSRYTPL